MRGGHRFSNLKFLRSKQSQSASGIELDYPGQVVLPKSPGKLIFTEGAVARRVGGYEQYV
jgi:hypothetical protein